ncbi:hypothetical protein DsansV1_C14g0131421 [Dioscorea sansibarensis]
MGMSLQPNLRVSRVSAHELEDQFLVVCTPLTQMVDPEILYSGSIYGINLHYKYI